MWDTEGMQLGRTFFALGLSLVAFACGSTDDGIASDDSNLDTSGCSGLDRTESQGSVSVSAARPPTNRCWNVDQSGLRVTYSWTQKNDSTPQKKDLGFWAALNGGGKFQKATSSSCQGQPQGGLGHDTSGEQLFTCTASTSFDFARTPEMKDRAFGADGHRIGWAVEVAVALDDNGNWDSLGGANYRFSF